MPQFRTLLPIQAAITSISLAACTPAPLQETKSFQQAFGAMDTVSQPLLDDLAISEKHQRQQAAIGSAKRVAAGKPPLAGHETCKARWVKVDRNTGFIDSLCEEDAPYFSEIGDPPKTQVFRRALALI